MEKASEVRADLILHKSTGPRSQLGGSTQERVYFCYCYKIREVTVQVLGLPQISCVTLDKSLYISGLQCLWLQRNGSSDELREE